MIIMYSFIHVTLAKLANLVNGGYTPHEGEREVANQQLQEAL